MKFSMLDHLDALNPDNGSHSSNEGSYQCPVCDANNFKIDLKTGKYGTFGCNCANTEAGKRKIRDAVAPPWEKLTRPKQKRIWTYIDLDGNPVLEVHRQDYGDGERKIWQKSLIKGKKPKELTVVPYRYQDCLKALEGGLSIFWVEGEPAADALWSLGIPATTTAGGCSVYKSEIHQGLFPVESLVICPDMDSPGLKYAEAIAADYPGAKWLYANSTSYLWNRLPESGGFDVADWIENGATKETILAAVGPRRDLEPPQSSPPPDTPKMSLEDARRRLEALASEGVSLSDVLTEIDHLATASGRSVPQLERLYRAVQQESDRAENVDIEAREIAARLPDAISARTATLPILEALSGDGGLFASEVLTLASAMPVAPEHLITALIPTLATSIGTRARLVINPAAGWVELAIYWVLIIALTGDKKTPMLNTAKSGLELLEDIAYTDYELALERYQQESDRFNALSPQEKANSPKPQPPIRKRYIVRDDTPQARSIVHYDNPRGLLRFRDEGSAFRSELGRFKSGNGDGGETEADLSEFNGGPLDRDRVKDGTAKRLSKTAFQRLGATQPELLKVLMGNHSDNRGWWSRYIFCGVDNPPGYIDFDQPFPPSTLTNTLVNLHQQLESFPEQDYLLSDAAKPVFQREYNRYQEIVLATRITDPGAAAAAVKLGTYLARLSLWLHLVNAALAKVEPALTISPETVLIAAQWTEFYWGQNQLLMAKNAPAQQLTGKALRVYDLLKRKGKPLTRSAITAGTQIKKDALVEILPLLVEQGYATADGPVNATKTHYKFNPDPEVEELNPESRKVESGFNSPIPFPASVTGEDFQKVEKLNGNTFSTNSNPPSNVHSPLADIEPMSDRELTELIGGEQS